MNRIYNILISPIAMALILLTGIVAMAVATFIENDFGANVAKQVVYNSRWFEVLLLLFIINLTGSIFKRKLYRKEKFTIFLFHIAFIVMILGAAFTRYVGYDGMMTIREGESSSVITTQNKTFALKLSDKNLEKTLTWDKSKIISKSGFSNNFKFDDKKFEIKLKQFYPNAIEKAIPVEGGKATIGFILASNNYRSFFYITKGETKKFGNITISYDSNNKNADIYFTQIDSSVFIGGKNPIIESKMGNNKSNTISDSIIPAELNKLYNAAGLNMVVQEILPEAVISVFPDNNKNSLAKAACIFTISNETKTKKFTLWESTNSNKKYNKFIFNDIDITAYYGAEIIELPFKLHLNKFEVERYPGSRSPSSFSSYVQILKPGEEPKPFHIYMNNILKMEGYRFYQSSYDSDEKGTVLSVNYDSLGTNVTYFGYFILFLGIVLSMVNKNSFLRNTIIPKSILVIIGITALGLLSSNKVLSQNSSKIKNQVSAEHAEEFGKLLIQDNKGRTEPVYTFASDLMRKLSHKEKMFNLTPVQMFIGMNVDHEYWMNMPIIKISNRELQKYLGLSKNYASYSNFLTQNGYKLKYKVEHAYNTPPGKQSKMDKAVIKADERMNICYSIFSGSYLKMFPVPNSEDHKWHTSIETLQLVTNSEDSSFLANILTAYFQELKIASKTGTYEQAEEYLLAIDQYQKKYAGYELPSKIKTNIEVKYYQWNIFKKLFPFYSTFGTLFLFVLIGGIISGKGVSKWISKTFFFIILAGFIAHILGIAVRWYISGHAPMSNGYESLVFISLITMLAGLIFSKQSLLALSATAVLAGFTLMVANLSFMDPEITNLVPVLKSYWLTIHVSVITGSYGFLGLGAILGLINMVLTLLQNKDNYARLEEAIDSLTIINNRTLILGLYFLTIGTFLGAVWANESWGRYWGWDPKETWSLITMIVYAFVTHARLIPGVKGKFTFNALSVFAFFSVLMTYFGVNYYLSGLHSYAAGDPVPVPNFVYISVGAIVTLTVGAYIKLIKNRVE